MFAVAVWAAGVSSAGAAPPAGDSATMPSSALFDVGTLVGGGAGLVVFSVGGAMLDAHSNADGSGPTGTWDAHFGGGNAPSFSGEVTCLSVSGNRATVGLTGTEFVFGQTTPFFGLFVLLDGGPAVPIPPIEFPPVELFSPPDTVEFRELSAPVGPTGCDAAAGVPPDSVERVLSNDVTVVDALSKEQCKGGGWRALGFRNQGQCVAQAVRGPKP